jgi:hypothetical protein
MEVLTDGGLPAETILYPTLVARAFQILVRENHL